MGKTTGVTQSRASRLLFSVHKRSPSTKGLRSVRHSRGFRGVLLILDQHGQHVPSGTSAAPVLLAARGCFLVLDRFGHRVFARGRDRASTRRAAGPQTPRPGRRARARTSPRRPHIDAKSRFPGEGEDVKRKGLRSKHTTQYFATVLEAVLAVPWSVGCCCWREPSDQARTKVTYYVTPLHPINNAGNPTACSRCPRVAPGARQDQCGEERNSLRRCRLPIPMAYHMVVQGEEIPTHSRAQ
jgi:hypothetical protein